MITIKTTRLARVLSAAFAVALLGAASTASAQTYGAELLINGGFEDGPLKAYSYKPTGWERAVDGNYWQLTTNLTGDDKLPGTTAGTVGSGHYSLRRVMFSGTNPSTTKASSVVYLLSSFADLAAGDLLKFSLDVHGTGLGGKVELYGEITFYDENSAVILNTETSRTQLVNSFTWQTLSAEIVIPQNAVSFVVSGVHTVTEKLTGTAYVTYDNFSVTQVIPEPATVTAIMALVVGSAVVGYRAKRRRG